MKALIAHDTAEALLAASRRSKSVRTGHRLLAIRDIMLGRARKWVCAQYGISRENLRHWIRWYNEEGSAGLADAVRSGRPPKLNASNWLHSKRVSACRQRCSGTAWDGGERRMCSA
jgi:transposase